MVCHTFKHFPSVFQAQKFHLQVCTNPLNGGGSNGGGGGSRMEIQVEQHNQHMSVQVEQLGQ